MFAAVLDSGVSLRGIPVSDESLLARIAEDFMGKMIPADIFDEVQRLVAEYRAGRK